LLVIAYHSQSGASAALARRARKAALAIAPEHVPVKLLRCQDAGAVEVVNASGLLLVCAENSGRLAGAAKDFLDRIFYPLHGRGVTIPYALLVSAGNDGRGAVAEAQRILRGIPFTEGLEPRIIRGDPDEAALQDVDEFAAGFATGLEMGIF
jgi:hypothetical protein